MKKLFIYIFSAFTMLFNTSCDESFLDKEPTLDLSEDKIYTDATRLNATLEGIYYTLKRGEFMGGKSYIAFDNRGNDIKNTESNAVLLTETYSMSVGITDAENSNFWYYAYLTINRANIFIDRCEKYNSESVLGAELYAQYIAEAKFLRSLCFYYLSQIYSQPYILDRDAKAIMLRTVGIDSGVYNNCKRSTISEVYEQILSDLSAENISALSTGSNTIASTSRATDATAKMLKMRVLMAMSNWEEAIAVGETISGYELADDVRSMYNEPYFTKETIFSLPMALTNRPNTQQSLYEFYCNDTEVLAIDYTHGVMAKAAYNISEDQRVAKLVNAQGRSTKFDLVTKLQSVPVFRYAETLLNLSECYVKVNRTEDAVTALTQVRRRSVSAENDIIELETLTEDALLEAIADEKRLEFIGEGISGIEIIRKGQTFEKGFSVAPSHSGYTWPIPQTERVVNKEWND